MSKLLAALSFVFILVGSVCAETLFEAAANSDLEAIRNLLEQGDDIKTVDGNGRTLLQAAAWHKPEEGEANDTLFRFLLESGIDVNAEKPYNEAAIFGVLKYRPLETLELFLEKGVELPKLSIDENPPLYFSAYNSDIRVTEFLLKKGFDVHARNQFGQSVLNAAIENPNLNVLRRFIALGVDVNHVGRYGHSPLTEAAWKDNIPAMEILLEAGAKPSLESARSLEAIKLMVRYGAKVSEAPFILFTISYHPNKEKIDLETYRYLVENGADLTTVSPMKYGVLANAAAIRAPDGPKIVRYLIDRGAVVPPETEPGFHPFASAVENPESAVFHALIEKLGPPDLSGELGRVLLYRAARNTNTDALEYLLEKGVDVESKPVKWDSSGPEPGDTALFAAAEAGKPAAVRMLVRHGANVNARNATETTPLFQAVKNDSSGDAEETVRVLLESKASPNLCDENGRTPLHLAVEKENLEIVRLLVGAGADVNARSRDGFTPLSGVTHGMVDPRRFYRPDRDPTKRAEILKYLVENGANVNQLGYGDVPPAFWLVAWSDLELLRWIVEEKDALTTGRFRGETALHQAAGRARPEVVQYLLDRGADVNVQDDDGATPIFFAAASNPDPKVFFLLVERGAKLDLQTKENGTTLLHKAMFNRRIEPVRFLLDHGLDVNAACQGSVYFGERPLHRACQFGTEEIVRLLVDRGADVNVQDGNGITPLHNAAFSKSTELVRFLLDKGAQVNAEGTARLYSGKRPIHAAVNNSDRGVMRLLLERGAEVNAMYRGYREGTPLYMAVNEYTGKRKTVELLLEHGADPLLGSDEQGHSALHAAAKEHKTQFLPLLLEKIDRSKIDLRDKKGNTSLHLAAKGEKYISSGNSSDENRETVKLLLDAGADIEAKTEDGETPYTLSIRNSNSDVARYLLQRGADDRVGDELARKLVFDAASNSRPGALTLLIEKGFNLDIRDEKGKTPLFYAARSGAGNVKLLLKHGLKADARDKEGRNALYETKDASVLRLLVKSGAVADARDRNDVQPIHLAASTHRTDLTGLRFLLDCGADVNARDQQGRTPLHYAAEKGDEGQITEFLLKEHADPETADKEGNRPLHLAAMKRNPGPMSALLKAKAEVNPLNHEGRTPLDLVEDSKYGHKWTRSTGGFNHTSRDLNAEVRSLMTAAGGIRSGKE